jgi:hypothetical protein
LLAATALSRLRDRNLLREWTDELQTALAGSDNETSLKIIACLASQNYFSKANLWQKLISDPDSRIRIEAARGMGELATNHYILRQALKDSNAIVIATALENLPDSLASHITSPQNCIISNAIPPPPCVALWLNI